MFHMFQVIYAHEWMNDAHDHEMQVQLGKTNTRGVKPLLASPAWIELLGFAVGTTYPAS